MAPGRRRLGTFLIAPAADRDDLLAVLQILDSTPAPHGRELAAALVLRDFCSERWPAIDWQVQRVGAHGANLIASYGTGPLLYSHLDTSLPGDATDAAVTGRTDPVGRLRITSSTVDGFGVGVARGPAAAALVAFTAASRGTLLLASSGTHRRGSGASGVTAWLEANPQPVSAIVAKSGPPGVLWSEPGALYLTVEVTGRQGVVMAPAWAVPSGGLPARIGAVLETLAQWCRDYAGRPGVGQLGASAGIGAITSGLPDKADLLPAAVRIALYVVTLPGADPDELAREVQSRVRAVLTGDVAACAVAVTADPVHGAGMTRPDAPIVAAARQVWTDEFGAPPQDLTNWTGSTDGVVLRGRGIDTVRLGPQPGRAEDDVRRDVLHLDELDAFVRIYRRLLDRPNRLGAGS